MFLYNENYELMSQAEIDAFKKELEFAKEPINISQDEIEADLENYYSQAEIIEKNQLGIVIEANRSFLGSGKNLFKKIKEVFCDFLHQGSTASDIIDKLLDVLATLIPGGILIKLLATKIIRYFINMGYNAICPVVIQHL